MVKLSADCVPAVGYVDRSFSRDILTMLDKFGGHGARETSFTMRPCCVSDGRTGRGC